jgi:hypothetical protein
LIAPLGYRQASSDLAKPNRLLFSGREQARGIASVGTGSRYVRGHDRAGTNYDIIDDAHRQDRSIGPDRNPIADHGLAPKLLCLGRTTGRESVVDEHHAMADKAILANRHQFSDETVGLYPGARTDNRALLNFGKRPDETIVANFAAVEIARFYNGNALTEFNVAHSSLMQFRRVHDATPSRLNGGVKRSVTS